MHLQEDSKMAEYIDRISLTFYCRRLSRISYCNFLRITLAKENFNYFTLFGNVSLINSASDPSGYKELLSSSSSLARALKETGPILGRVR